MVERVSAEIAGRQLSFSNLAKVLYPACGFTKAEVIDYYTRIAPVMLAHVAGRGVTLRRYPDGVDGKSFFEKRCPSHRPDWVDVHDGPGDRDGTIGYCALDEVAALAWTANLAALEIHSPMALGSDLEAPTMAVFDLDPGAPATIVECCAVAIDIRDVLDSVGLVSFAKTSGSKGLQLYVPLNRPHSHDHASDFALAVAQLLEARHPDRVLSRMTKRLREGKVFIDWSQNSRHKTTVAPYSLRARPTPTVSTPITWDEVEAGSQGGELTFDAAAVLERVERHGDMFEPTLTTQQSLPHPQGQAS